MKTKCYLLLCMFVCTTAFAQHGVKGKIVDAGTGVFGRRECYGKK